MSQKIARMVCRHRTMGTVLSSAQYGQVMELYDLKAAPDSDQKGRSGVTSEYASEVRTVALRPKTAEDVPIQY